MSERESAGAGAGAVAAAREIHAQGSPASASPARLVVSGLGLSGSSSCNSPGEESSGRSRSPPPPEEAPVQGRRVQDRLEWIQPKMSRKKKWRIRQSLRRRQEAGPSAPVGVSSVMMGRCFKCLRPGHPKRDCRNEQVCFRCGEEGHGSGGCKRPRSPDSEEVLRQQAMVLVDRRMASRRGAAQPGTRGQGAPAAWQPGVPDRRAPAVRGRASGEPSPPPSSAGSWAAESAPRVDLRSSPSAWASPCIVRRTVAMDDLERRLQCSLVAYVGGSRPAVSCDQVAAVLVQRVGIPRAAFTVHRFRPEDFLVVFATPEVMERVSARQSVPYAFFTLYFRRWTRQALAQSVVMRSKVHLAVEGIPAHAWEKEVVQQLVGSSCSLVQLAPETASRADLSVFRAEAWTTDMEEIPPARDLWVPEPNLSAAVAGGSRQPRSVPRDRELGLLKYKVIVHVERVEEFVLLDGVDHGHSAHGEGWRWPPVSGDGEGFWTSRSLRWTPGVPDSRSGGHGGGGVVGGGPAATGASLQWQLPHLEPHATWAQRIRAATDVRTVVEPVVAGSQRSARRDITTTTALEPVAVPEGDPVGASDQNSQPILLGGLGIGAPRTDGEGGVADFEPLVVGDKAGCTASSGGDKDGEAPLAVSGVVKEVLTAEVVPCPGPLPGPHVALEPTSSTEAGALGCSPPLSPMHTGGTLLGLKVLGHNVEDADPGPGRVKIINGTEYVQFSITEGQSVPVASVNNSVPGMEALSVEQHCDEDLSMGSISLEPLISFHGPDENMQGVVMNQEIRHNMTAQEEAALGKMCRFCATILKKLAPPLLREIQTSTAARLEGEPATNRRVTRAAATAGDVTPAPRKPWKVSAAETALLKALGITEAGLEASDEAIEEFRALFDSPVREQHLRAMAAIFGKTMPDRFERPAAGSVVVPILAQ
ncbi:hypothetical protein QYE76_024920 [Lolium multiflorum]|uniref:CCHC-type domain-containing protein n=1 Tax=Lolium multiflorum TaxID=4521 RepID=A0AAD8RD13_LOLMU|nr:hypothetical protein QYE76_024920 [Lolium multiflorum]